MSSAVVEFGISRNDGPLSSIDLFFGGPQQLKQHFWWSSTMETTFFLRSSTMETTFFGGPQPWKQQVRIEYYESSWNRRVSDEAHVPLWLGADYGKKPYSDDGH